ncbi:MAG: TolC family outer membrane protein [Sphingomonadales bacterium]|nr:TolC family outer membrane protein [Sphingomonadales bacterium]
MKAMRARNGVISAAVAVALLANPAWAEQVSLRDAVTIGVNRSPELGQAQARTRAAEAGRDAAEREWLPKIEATGVYGWRHLENDARILTGLSAIKTRPYYATISVNQPLWDFGRRYFSTRAQDGRRLAASWDEEAAGEFAAYTIARAYLQVRAQQSITEEAEANLSFHRKLNADILEGVDRGVMTIAEKQQAEERLQGARLALDQARADLDTARAELALLLGVSDFQLLTPPDPGPQLPASLDAALAIAQTSDPRLRSSEAKLRASKSNAERTKIEYLPSIALQGTVRTGRDFEGYRGTTRDYEMLVIARWTLFDGGITSARIREANAGVDEASFALGQAQRESELAIRKSWIAIDGWQSRLALQQDRLKVARDLRVSYVEQFGIGRRSLLDLLDAQNAVFNASTEATVAQHGLWLAQYGLLGQVGRLRSFLGVSSDRIDPRIYGPR